MRLMSQGLLWQLVAAPQTSGVAGAELADRQPLQRRHLAGDVQMHDVLRRLWEPLTRLDTEPRIATNLKAILVGFGGIPGGKMGADGMGHGGPRGGGLGQRPAEADGEQAEQFTALGGGGEQLGRKRSHRAVLRTGAHSDLRLATSRLSGRDENQTLWKD